MKASWRFILPALALLGLLVAALLNPALLMAYLVDPLTRILWLGLRLFMIVDQEVYWTLLVFAAFTLLVRLVPVRAAPSIRPPGYAASLPPEDRAAHWQSLIRAARSDPAARQALQQALVDLFASLGPAEDGVPPVDLQLPPCRPGLLAALRVRARSPLLHRLLPAPARDIEFDQKLAQILSFMETRMEAAPHDPPTAPDDH